MLKFASFFFVILTLYTSAQTTDANDDFEGNGNISTWSGDNCTITSNFSNPFSNTENNSSTVLKYEDYGSLYANVRFDVNSNFDLSNNATFSLKIYVPSANVTGTQNNQVSIKLQDGTITEPWVTQSEIIKPINLDQWQTVSFNFKEDTFVNFDPNSLPPSNRTDFNRIVIQINGENNTDLVTAYIDDFLQFETITNEPVFDNLVFYDEFDTNGAIDASKWHHQTQLPNGSSWYNGEVQHYTNRIENSFVEDGSLHIKAIKESFTDQNVTKQYTSARLNSKFAFTYGKVEVRAKLPSGIGTWPAAWMLGKNTNEDGGYWDLQGFGTTGWPASGEVDIMEHWGHNQNYVQSALHTPSSFGATTNLGGRNISTASTEFHIYTLVWTEEKMTFSIDGITHYTYNPAVKDASTWPFDLDQYLLLNFAIQPSIESSFTDATFDIDYVRVYQESENLSLEDISNTSTHKVSFYPNPVDDKLTISWKENTSQNAKINIYNSLGKLIQSFRKEIQNNSLVLDNLSVLEKGIYFLQIESAENKDQIKIIKK